MTSTSRSQLITAEQVRSEGTTPRRHNDVRRVPRIVARMTIAVVGGHGYVGARIAKAHGPDTVVVVSRDGTTQHGIPSVAWPDWTAKIAENPTPRVIWMLDHRHDDERLLRELAAAAPMAHVTMCGTCTVYGDRGDALCTESTALRPTTANAEAKLRCETFLAESGLGWCSLRLGALFAPNIRGARKDRVQKMVEQARAGRVVVPDPTHWRGWLHADQAARALWRASVQRADGAVLVASENHTFGEAAGYAAELYDAEVAAAGEPDLSSYRIDAALARSLGILDELPGEGLADTIRAFATSTP